MLCIACLEQSSWKYQVACWAVEVVFLANSNKILVLKGKGETEREMNVMDGAFLATPMFLQNRYQRIPYLLKKSFAPLLENVELSFKTCPGINHYFSTVGDVVI